MIEKWTREDDAELARLVGLGEYAQRTAIYADDLPAAFYAQAEIARRGLINEYIGVLKTMFFSGFIGHTLTHPLAYWAFVNATAEQRARAALITLRAAEGIKP